MFFQINCAINPSVMNSVLNIFHIITDADVGVGNSRNDPSPLQSKQFGIHDFQKQHLDLAV